LHNKFNYLDFANLSCQDIKKSINFNLKYLSLAIDILSKSQQVNWDRLQSLFYIPLYNLYNDWNILNHLEATNSSKDYRKLINYFLPKLNKVEATINNSQLLYNLFKRCYKIQNLDKEAKLVIKRQLQAFKDNGILLNKKAKNKLTLINAQIETIQVKFEQNVLDSLALFVLYASPKKLQGLPNELINSMLITDTKDVNYNKCKVTLEDKCFQAIMDLCQNRKLREKIYLEHLLVASKDKFNNSSNIIKLLQLKLNKAQLLGYDNYVSLTLKDRMLNKPKKVDSFLSTLVSSARTKAVQELDGINEFAKQKFNITKLQKYDLSFITTQIIQEKLNFSEWRLQQYFNSDYVIKNTLNLIGELFKLNIVVNSAAPKWHSTVLVYDVYKNNKLIGTLSLDLFARANKQSGAWMASLQDRFVYNDIIKLPHAAVMCNFNRAIPTIAFDDINTLFHEIGHALHHLLSEINHYTLSGINNVEWDAIELPSQLIENFTWNYEVLKRLSCHVSTNKTLPKELYNQLVASRKYNLAIKMLKQVEYGILDIQLHKLKSKQIKNYLKLYKDIVKETSILKGKKSNNFLNSFTHIFAGDYAAGYYSYKWSEVMALNILDEFKKLPFEKYPKLAQKFSSTILAQGSAQLMQKNFYDMLKKNPSLNLFLKNYYLN